MGEDGSKKCRGLSLVSWITSGRSCQLIQSSHEEHEKLFEVCKGLDAMIVSRNLCKPKSGLCKWHDHLWQELPSDPVPS